MSRRCKILREKALHDGIGSPAAARWRLHAKSCPECQTEQFLLGALQRQGQAENRHLGRDDVAQLLESARKHRGTRSQSRPLRTWTWRLASVLLLFGVALHLSRNERVRHAAEGLAPQVQAQSADDAVGNYGMPLSPAHQEHDQTVEQMTSTPASRLPMPASMPGFFLRDRLLDIREEMDMRRQELLNMQERDLGDWDRDKAWEMVSPANLARV